MMSFDGKGIYIITYSKRTTSSAALGIGTPHFVDALPVRTYDAHETAFDQLWLIEDCRGEFDTYTIRNLYTGAYLDLSNSSKADGTTITGFHGTGGSNQKWLIKRNGGNNQVWKIRNKATGTFVDLKNGGTDIVGWQGSWNDVTSLGHQDWHFRRVSLTYSQLDHLIRSDGFVLPGASLKRYNVDKLYLLLPRSTIESIIYGRSGLAKRTYRFDIFDCDDFALAMKASCIEWGNEYFQKTDGFAIMCGLMTGKYTQFQPPNTYKDFAHAYNWFVDRDTQKVVYFEPQRGKFLDSIKYFGHVSFI